jgi:hypothetical protein
MLSFLAAWQALAPVSLDLPSLPTYDGGNKVHVPNDTAQSGGGSLSKFNEIEDRPLFVFGRRPQVAVPLKPPPQTSALSAYTIVGIIAAPDRAVALLHAPSGATIHLRVGQILDGCTLETITPNKLIFASGDERQELDFKSNKTQPGQSGSRTSSGMTQQRPRVPSGYPGVQAQ